MAVRRLVAGAPGLIIAAGGVAAVAGLVDAVRESNGLAADDPGLANDMVGVRTVELTDLARALTFLGDVPVLMVFTLIAALVLWRVTGSRRSSVLLLVAMAGSAALTYGIKLLVERPRPSVSYVLGAVDTTYSFPSGHTLNSAVFFLTVAGLLWMLRAGLVWRLAGTAVAVLLSLGIGLSRIYLGYHWATDVLAGWLLAATWLSLVATGAYFARAPGG